MELLSVIKARSIWIFDFNELNPRGKRVLVQLLPWLKENYEFSKVPASVDDFVETKALVLLDGSFQTSSKDTVGIDLKIYNDGFVVDSRASTKDNDDFLGQMLKYAAAEFSLVYSPKMIRKKLYLSELTLRSKRALHGLNPRLKAFADKISLLISSDSKVELASIGFWSEQKAPALFSPFRFERKIDALFSEDRYYSTAPLQTADHLELLDELEIILSG